MSFLCGVTTGVAIFLTVLAFIGAIGLIVLFYFLTRRERFRYLESKFINKDKLPKDFDLSVQRQIHRLTSRSSFYIAEVHVCDIESMEVTFGVMQVTAALDVLRKRCSAVFPFIVEVCKYRKDTICILITASTNNDELQNYFENLLIEARKPIVLAGALRIEVDINIAVVNCPIAGRTLEELDKNAKLAMVVSKRKGYNNYVFHTKELNSSESDQFKQYMEIREAIANNEFTLYYQKIVDTKTFVTYGFECLLRWNHRELGVLPPDSFLRLLEHSGDINWVGQWGFEQLCSLIFEWKKKKVRKYIMTYNLSPKQLGNRNLYDDFRKIVRNYDIDPGQICLEISDYEVWNKLDIARMNIKNFREMGFHISLDDYKAEQENDVFLDLIRPNMVKLSRALIAKAMENDATKETLVKLRAYSKEKGFAVVACGIENEEMLDFVAKYDIIYAQGYFFAKPKPIGELQL